MRRVAPEHLGMTVVFAIALVCTWLVFGPLRPLHREVEAARAARFEAPAPGAGGGVGLVEVSIGGCACGDR